MFNNKNNRKRKNVKTNYDLYVFEFRSLNCFSVHLPVSNIKCIFEAPVSRSAMDAECHSVAFNLVFKQNSHFESGYTLLYAIVYIGDAQQFVF